MFRSHHLRFLDTRLNCVQKSIPIVLSVAVAQNQFRWQSTTNSSATASSATDRSKADRFKLLDFSQKQKNQLKEKNDDEFVDIMSEEYQQSKLAAQQAEVSTADTHTSSGSSHQKTQEASLSDDEKRQLYNKWYEQAEEFIYDQSERRNMSLANATKLLDMCVELFPKRSRGYALRAKCYLLKGETELARRDLDRAVELGSQDPEVYYHRGVTFMQKQMVEESLQCYDQALRLLEEMYGNNTSQDIANARDLLISRCLNNKAYLIMQYQSDFSVALNLLDRSIALLQALHQSPAATICGHDASAAAANQDVQIVDNDTDIQPYYNRARALMELDRIEEAVKDFERYVSGDKSNATALTLLAQCLLNLGRSNEAIQSVDQVLELVASDPVDENDVGARELRRGQLYELYTLRGFGHAHLGQYDLAVNDLTKACRAQPQAYVAFSQRGQVHLMFRHFEKAVVDFSTALQRDGSNLHSLWLRSQAYESLGRFDSAIEDLKQIIEIVEEDLRQRKKSREQAQQAAQGPESASMMEHFANELKQQQALENGQKPRSQTFEQAVKSNEADLLGNAMGEVAERRRQRSAADSTGTQPSEDEEFLREKEEYDIMLSAIDTKIALLQLRHFEQLRQRLLEETNPENRAKLNDVLGQLQKNAISYLSRAIHRDPQCIVAMHHRGQLLATHFNAIHKQQRQLQDQPASADDDSALSSRLEKGDKALQMIFEKAKLDLTAVVEKCDDILTTATLHEVSRGKFEKMRIYALYNRGVLLYKMGHFVEAAEDFEKVVVLCGKNGPRLGIPVELYEEMHHLAASSKLKSGNVSSMKDLARYYVNKLLRNKK